MGAISIFEIELTEPFIKLITENPETQKSFSLQPPCLDY